MRGPRTLTSFVVGLWLLAASPLAAQPAVPLEVTGATSAAFDSRTGVWVLRGAPVVITRGPTRLEAAEIRYEERSGAATAAGRVVVRHETLLLSAARAAARLREAYVVAEGEVVITDRREGGDARLRAGRVEVFLSARRAVASGNPVLTSREARLTAERLAYDGQTQTATATGGAELVLPEGRLTAEYIGAQLDEETAEARGDVRIAAGELAALAPLARLDRRGGLAVLSGGAVLRRGGDTLTAEQITVDLRGQRAVASGQPRLVFGAAPGP